MTPDRKKKLALWIIGVAAACILIFLGVQNIDKVAAAVSWCFGLVSSLVIGLAMALIINVPMSFFEKIFWPRAKKKVAKGLRRPVAYIVSIILILAVLAGIIWLVIPELVEAITAIVTWIIDFITKLNSMSEAEIAELPFGEFILGIDWNKILETLKNWLKTEGGALVGTAVGTVGTLFGVIFDFFISVVFSVYILFSKEKLKAQCVRIVRVWVPSKFGTWFIHACSVLGGSLRNFVFGQSLEAVIIGVLCMLGMLILDIPYAAPVGALVGVTALIPIVGSFIGAIVGAFLIVTVSPIKAVIFIVYLIILQQIEGNLIYPRVMGSKVNLPGMWILAAVTVGGGIAGPVGMLLSVPLASTLYVLVNEATDKREARLTSEAVNTTEEPEREESTDKPDADASEETDTASE